MMPLDWALSSQNYCYFDFEGGPADLKLFNAAFEGVDWRPVICPAAQEAGGAS
jgi:hypothetical protein